MLHFKEHSNYQPHQSLHMQKCICPGRGNEHEIDDDFEDEPTDEQ